MIKKVNIDSLNDRFLKFKMDYINDSFEHDAWTLVLDIYSKKIDHSTCYICKELCLEHCISCFTCKYWYHIGCAKPSRYIQTNPESKWYCIKAKIEPTLECRI